MAPQRILFTDSTQGGVLGGSLTGILELLPHLDRARFEPVLALYEHKPIIEEIEAGGSRARVEAVFGVREHVQAIEAVFGEILAHHRRAT